MTHARRSCLSVPGTQQRFHDKAEESSADMVMFDLEDSVVPAAKARGREMVVAALRGHEYAGKLRSVRVNAGDSQWCFEDIRAVVEGAGERLDTIVLPKVEGARHVHFADVLLRQLEAAGGLERRIGLEVQIESARGLESVSEIASASPRLESLIFGPGDLMATLGVPELTIGRTPDYSGEFFHYVHWRILVAARANGLQAIDGPYAQVRDLEGLRRSALPAAALGYDGKWALTPNQAEVLNEVFAPRQEDFDKAAAILDAYAHATGVEQTGAVMLGEEMIDEASRKLAAVMVERGRAAGMTARPWQPAT
ncbi:MAG TPA: CoA ester lyase [Candidatus Dormibacteraeota bacterium]